MYGLLSVGQRAVLDSLLTMPSGERVSELDRLRRGPVRVSGPQMKWSLQRAEEIAAVAAALCAWGLFTVPTRQRRLAVHAVPGQLRQPPGRDRRHVQIPHAEHSHRLATLLATAVYLAPRAVDDALDLLEVLTATKLLAKARRETVPAGA